MHLFYKAASSTLFHFMVTPSLEQTPTVTPNSRTPNGERICNQTRHYAPFLRTRKTAPRANLNPLHAQNHIILSGIQMGHFKPVRPMADWLDANRCARSAVEHDQGWAQLCPRCAPHHTSNRAGGTIPSECLSNRFLYTHAYGLPSASCSVK